MKNHTSVIANRSADRCGNPVVKRAISIVLILMLLLSFAGCHGSVDREVFHIPEEFDTSRNYEITFWAKNDTNMTQVNIYKKAIEDFQTLYPNITVKLRLYTDYGRLYNDVITNIATSTTPNVCITYPDHIATYMTGDNVVVPLDDLFTHPKYGLGGREVKFDAPTVSQIIPKFLTECVIDNQYYAIPYMRSTEACYVNKTFVEALGFTLPEKLTWDFVWEVSEAAMAKNEDGTFKINGQKTMLPFIYKSTDNMMIHLLAQKDAGYSSETGEILIFNDTTRELLFNIADHVQTRAFNTFKLAGYPANFLNAGQCIFAVDSTAGATWMGCEAPLIDIPEENLVKFETVVMEIPQFDTNNPKMISQGPSMCVFNKEDPQEVLASWLFAQYMLTNEVQIAYAQTEGYAPVTSKAQNSAEYQDYLSRSGEDNELYYNIKIDATKLLIDNTEHTFVTPVFNGSASLRDAAGQMIEDVNKSVRRKQTVDEKYMDKLFSDMTSLYRLDQIQSSGGKQSFDGLPNSAVMLLSALALIWVCMGAYVLKDALKKKKS